MIQKRKDQTIMKRLLITSLILIATISLITACSGGSTESPLQNVPDNGDDSNHAEYIVTIDKTIEALQNPDDWMVIDVRTPEEYNGESYLPNAFGTGRIKGAVNIDSALVFDSDGELLEREELLKLYEIIGDKKVIVYCHGGRRSETIWAILNDLGFAVWHYDDSWIDWSREASIAEGGSNEVVLNLTETWIDNEGVIE
jgi:thiosulfate/3-mercaptopyruvate sulfurtransferase